MKIFALSHNYEGNIPPTSALLKRNSPAVYMKAESALLKNSKPFFVPDFLGRIDLEAHVVVRLSRLGKSIPERFAHRYYDALTLGVAFTAHDVLRESVASGLPADMAVGLDGSAAIGEWMPIEQVGGADNLDFHLDIDGQTVQRGNTADMLTSVDRIISYISQFMTLKMGDVIFTGCPTLPARAIPDQRLSGWIGGEKVLEMNCK